MDFRIENINNNVLAWCFRVLDLLTDIAREDEAFSDRARDLLYEFENSVKSLIKIKEGNS